MNLKSYKYFLLASIALAFFVSGGAALGAEIEINVAIPGGNAGDAANPNPVGVIGNLYQFALMIGGLLAFGVIVYASIKYSMSAGNPSSQSDAKDRIVQALIGLLLLAGGGIVLATLRPGFSVDEGGFNIPGITELKEVEPIIIPPEGGVPGCTSKEEAAQWCVINARVADGFCDNGQIVCCVTACQ